LGENTYFLGYISLSYSVIIILPICSSFFNLVSSLCDFYCVIKLYFSTCSENTKNLLVECAASHLRHNKFASTFGIGLSSSSGRILLQSIPGQSFIPYFLSLLFYLICNVYFGCHLTHIYCSKFYYNFWLVAPNVDVVFLTSGTELYRERLVRALAQDLQVPLLVLDNSILAPYVSSGRI